MALVVQKAELSYVPKSQLEDAKPVTFKFRIPTFGDQYNSISLKDDAEGKPTLDLSDFGKQMYLLLCRCVTGWENVFDEDNKPLKFDVARPEKSISVIPYDMAFELYNHIMEKSNKGKSEGEQKN